MKKPVKILLVTCLTFAGLLIVALLVAIVWLDRIVKAVVEEGGTAAAGTTVTLSSASVKAASGRLGLDGFAIANPTGFRAEPFVRLGHVEARWENGSLFSDELVIDELAVDDVILNLEYADGHTNFGTIVDHLQGPPTASTSPAGSSQRTLTVRHAIVRGVKASVHAPGLAESSAGVVVRDVELHDFKTSGSATEVIGKLTQALVDGVLDSALASGSADFPKEIVGNLRRSVEKRVEDLKGQAENVLDSVKGVGELFKKPK